MKSSDILPLALLMTLLNTPPVKADYPIDSPLRPDTDPQVQKCIEAMESKIISAGSSLQVIDNLFHTDFVTRKRLDKGPLWLAHVYLSHTADRPWHLDLTYDAEGKVRDYSLTNQDALSEQVGKKFSVTGKYFAHGFDHDYIIPSDSNRQIFVLSHQPQFDGTLVTCTGTLQWQPSRPQSREVFRLPAYYYFKMEDSTTELVDLPHLSRD